MFRVRHCRVTSLASAMLRMISLFSEGHTLPAPPRPVNARKDVGKYPKGHSSTHSWNTPWCRRWRDRDVVPSRCLVWYVHEFGLALTFIHLSQNWGVLKAVQRQTKAFRISSADPLPKSKITMAGQ